MKKAARRRLRAAVDQAVTRVYSAFLPATKNIHNLAIIVKLFPVATQNLKAVLSLLKSMCGEHKFAEIILEKCVELCYNDFCGTHRLSLSHKDGDGKRRLPGPRESGKEGVYEALAGEISKGGLIHMDLLSVLGSIASIIGLALTIYACIEAKNKKK